MNEGRTQREPDRNPRKALGKGLSALLPRTAHVPSSEPPVPIRADSHPSESDEQFLSIPLDQISPDNAQPRLSVDEDKLSELAQSIRANGVIQPITVRRDGPNRFRIIAGERRYRAAALAGLKEIPALVRDADQHERLEMALIENIQREDLNPIEIATAFERLANEYRLSHDQIAEQTGKDRSTVTNFLRLLRLSSHVRQALSVGKISMGHARALLGIADEEQQADLCDRIILKQLSVRVTEEVVKKLTSSAAERKVKATEKSLDPNIRAALDEMESALGTKVRLVARSDNSGRIEIDYYSQDDLDRIYSVIVKA